MPDRQANSWWPKLLDDARQGVVGGLAYLGVVGLPLALFGVVGGTVPVWTLALPLILSAPLAAVIAGQRRKLLVVSGELREARRQASEARKAEVHFRQQLDLAALRDGPLDPTAQGFLRRIAAFRENVPDANTRYADGAEIAMIRSLIDDMREKIGNSRTLLSAENVWAGHVSNKPETLRLTLSQLEALAEEFGLRQASGQAEAPKVQGSAR